ncbi:alanyl-tRNA editing protein [Radiobacillus sp. PE A8.2]|uniref:alanyl-tRNA editing protein n=1 Tax=Radiobacillus sp. PE A8.2 TaxID=3380349 RepID=UPI00388E600B
MENKLYYQDAYQKQFKAKVIKQGKDQEGRYYVSLDQTAFYPTGGGQPYDTGTLNGYPVLDVEMIDGQIRHYLKEPLFYESEVTGMLDWQRRFDHMQQHAGQHILSATFEDILGYKTVSFHLGSEICTIDLETGQVSEYELTKIEEICNRIILENRPIETVWVTPEEVKNYRLRKNLSVDENIRLVIIPEFDYNGCGGTHPNSTGQIMSIKILGWEKQRKQVRVHFVCGRRVLAQLAQKHRVIQTLNHKLRAPENELAPAVDALLAKQKDTEKALSETEATVLDLQANDILYQANNHSVVAKAFMGYSMKDMQTLTRKLIAHIEDGVVILVSQNGDKLQVVFGRGTAVTHISMKKLLGNILPIINGKGGGSHSLAQGGGEAIISAEQLLEKIKEVVQ